MRGHVIESGSSEGAKKGWLARRRRWLSKERRGENALRRAARQLYTGNPADRKRKLVYSEPAIRAQHHARRSASEPKRRVRWDFGPGGADTPEKFGFHKGEQAMGEQGELLKLTDVELLELLKHDIWKRAGWELRREGKPPEFGSGLQFTGRKGGEFTDEEISAAASRICADIIGGMEYNDRIVRMVRAAGGIEEFDDAYVRGVIRAGLDAGKVRVESVVARVRTEAGTSQGAKRGWVTRRGGFIDRHSDPVWGGKEGYTSGPGKKPRRSRLFRQTPKEKAELRAFVNKFKLKSYE